MNISYRIFDFHNENIERLFDLIKATYKIDVDKERWNWQYFENPSSDEIKIFVAESGDKILGATSQIPANIKWSDNIFSVYYASDSMVHPEFRRHGIMSNIYQQIISEIPITYAKGTAPGMYRLRLKVGFKPILPNTFMVSILSFSKWIGCKLNVCRSNYRWEYENPIYEFKDFTKIERFGVEFDKFFDEISGSYYGTFLKNSSFMNWRYIKIPYKKYQVFYRKKTDKIVSVIVLGGQKESGKIVDFMWNPVEKDEPEYTIKFAKKYLKSLGFVKVLCWSTNSSLRKALKQNLFFDRGDTPNFTVYAPVHLIDLLSCEGKFHFVDGDCDSEYADA